VAKNLSLRKFIHKLYYLLLHLS